MPSQRRPPVPALRTCGGAHVPGRRGPSATGRGRGAPSAPGPCALQSDGPFPPAPEPGCWASRPCHFPGEGQGRCHHPSVSALPEVALPVEGSPCAQQMAGFPQISQGCPLPAAPAHSASRRPRGLASSESGRLCRVASRALLGAHAETPARLPGSLLPHVLSLCSGVWRGGSCGHDDPHPHLVPTMASPEARRVPDRLGLGARAGRGQGAARHSGTWDVAGLLSSSRPLCGHAEPQDSPAEAPGRPRLECTLPNPWLLKNCLSSLLLSR